MKLIIRTVFLLIVAFLGGELEAASVPSQLTRRSSSQCQPFHATFKHSDVSNNPNAVTPFVAVSPQSSYSVDSGGLALYLEKPEKPVKTKDGVNDIVAEGATINSTFTVLYGKVSFEVSAPTEPGVVTAAILIANQHDEIDIELLGGDPRHWQSNIFTTSPKDQQPLWGVFGEIEDLPKNSDIDSTHNYTIDWNEERIVWSVDGSVVRTLHKSQTNINGTYHFPSHAARVQLGIWDASNPSGTSEWARGPINWSSAPHKMAATFRSVTVACPY
ncbi:concanavalin A-like lectin/glucanase [Cytidiella melzeri]|nr:concanavalin A-like lectin/glucanase [Cytidiella melzeri]